MGAGDDGTTVRDLIRDVPDYPQPGVLFKDITPLLGSGEGLRLAMDQLTRPWAPPQGDTERKIDKVLGIEARGFIVATPVALALGLGFVPVRKPGKLPSDRIAHTYELEYGTDTLEMHSDAIEPGERVLVVDDVLATGGTASAAVDLVAQVGGIVVGAAFLVELAFLGGRARLGEIPTTSVVVYD